MLQTHLTVLETSASQYSDSPVFKLARSDAQGHVQSWSTVTYRQFLLDVESFARHWLSTLSSIGVRPGSVVSLWVGGYTYAKDVLNIYALSRAGFVPQLFSLRLDSVEVIFELMHAASSKALIYDASFKHLLVDCPLPAYLVPESVASTSLILPSINPNPDDLAFLFHTSGSSGGSPKLVPCTYRWLDATVTKSKQVCRPHSASRQDVTVWMGSVAHIGQSFMLIGTLQHGSCVIQPTTIAFSTLELVAMIQHAGLNRLNQFAAFLAAHLRAARDDPKLLGLLRGLDEILSSGMALPHEATQFAIDNGLKLRIIFGSTEAGATLTSETGGNPAILEPLDDTAYQFVPVSGDAEGSHQSTGRLFEFVILDKSADCPHPSLRSADGNFHTGDLFLEAAPGRYVSQGRDDDWIKSSNALRCDTRAIEDNARMMCGNLISECVVVGSGRPSPVLFVEPAVEMDAEKLKKEIIRKTRAFHTRRYIHERITSPQMIVVVPPKTLPRTATKGNIRRKAVEEAYRAELDGIYAC